MPEIFYFDKSPPHRLSICGTRFPVESQMPLLDRLLKGKNIVPPVDVISVDDLIDAKKYGRDIFKDRDD